MADDGTISWQELLTETTARLHESGVDDAPISARRIVEEASGFDGAQLNLHLRESVTKRGVAHLDSMIARRIEGEPLQYVVGRWSFRMLDLLVDSRALIPRPETEEVAGWAIAEARRFSVPVVADLGTGTGAIGLSVATEITDSVVHLTDVSSEALAVARANLVGTGRAGVRVTISEGSWFSALPESLQGSLHLVVSNPPYVAEGDELPPVVADWEPEVALRAGEDGLRDLLPIADEAIRWLAPGGALVLEMASEQTSAVADHCLAVGFETAEIRADLSGHDRAVIARAPKN